jgi:hypothetical protein
MGRVIFDSSGRRPGFQIRANIVLIPSDVISYNVIDAFCETERKTGITMRHKQAATLFLLLLGALSGCQSGAEPLPVGAFVNQSDPSQVLQLTLDPSQTTNVFIRVSIETGANKYFGKSVGTYVLRTSQGTSSGTFVWAKSIRDGSLQEVFFTAADGKRWEINVERDGSLRDAGGIAWKRS